MFTEYDLIPKRRPNAIFYTAQLPDNAHRNRFKDVLPYEVTRTVGAQPPPHHRGEVILRRLALMKGLLDSMRGKFCLLCALPIAGWNKQRSEPAGNGLSTQSSSYMYIELIGNPIVKDNLLDRKLFYSPVMPCSTHCFIGSRLPCNHNQLYGQERQLHQKAGVSGSIPPVPLLIISQAA